MPSIIGLARLGCALLLAVGAVLPARAAPPIQTPVDQQIARCFELRRAQPDQAVALAQRLLPTTRQAPTQQLKLLSCLAQAQAIAGDSPQAVATVDQAVALLKQHPQPDAFTLRVYSNAAAALQIAGQLQRALDYYNLAFEAARAGDAAAVQVSTLINVALIYSEELAAYDTAETFYARAQGIADHAELRNALLPYNRAVNQLRAGHDALAGPLLDAAERLATDAGTALVIARARAERLALQARHDLTQHVRPALAHIAQEQIQADDPSGASTTLVRASALALRDGQAADALADAVSALTLARSGGFRHERREALQAQLTALQALGRYREALQVQQQLSTIQLDALRAQHLESLAGLQSRLEDSNRAQELADMRTDRRIQDAQLQNARSLRNLAIAGFVLLALLSAGFFGYQRRVHVRLRQLSNTDAMTGLLNRREANQRMAALPAPDADRRNVAFLVDIDHFKDINDRYGHEAGDALLMEIARRLSTEGAPGDIVARWGGEEFLVARADVDATRAAQIAEDMRACISDRPVQLPGGGSHRMTASIGFACWPFYPDASDHPRGDFHCALSLADRALYASKHGGRDAWTGLWGRRGQHQDRVSALDHPDRAEHHGQIDVLASRTPVPWRTRAASAD